MGKLPKQISNLIDEITKSDYEVVKKSRKIHLGTMALYYYPTPKTASTLEVYDQLPYVFILGGGGGYLWGLNVHYFDWSQRLKFMKYLNSKKGNLRYKDVKKAFQSGSIPLGMANYCFRKYLVSHIKSNIRLFDIKDNEEFKDAYSIAKEVLPVFKGKKDSQVFKDIKTKFKQHKSTTKK